MTELASYLPGIFLIYGVFLLQNATPGPNLPAVAGIPMAHGKTSAPLAELSDEGTRP